MAIVTGALPHSLWTNLAAIGPPNTGKSTLFGYFLLRKGEFSADHVTHVFRQSAQFDKRDLRLAFLLDPGGPRRKADDGAPAKASVETSHVGVSLGERRFLLIDNPGHPSFIHSILVGLSQAAAGVLVVDCRSAQQLPNYTRLIPYPTTPESFYDVLLSEIIGARLFGISEFIVVITKMDLSFDPESDFAEARSNVERMMKAVDDGLGDRTAAGRSSCVFVPTAVHPSDDPPSGVNVVSDGPTFPWLNSQKAVSFEDALLSVTVPSASLGPLRFGVERDFWSVPGTKVVVTGKILSGTLSVGDTVILNPTRREARVSSLKMRDERERLGRQSRWGVTKTALPETVVGVALRLRGSGGTPAEVMKEVGHRLVLSRPGEFQPTVSDRARIAVSATTRFPIGQLGRGFHLKAFCGSQSAGVTIEEVVSINGVSPGDQPSIREGDIAEFTIRFAEPMAIDSWADCSSNSRIALVEGHVVVAGGTISKVLHD